MARMDQGGRRSDGRKGRALFHPLRLALTGREHGPELKKLLPLIGREKSLARLKGTNGVISDMFICRHIWISICG